MDVLSDIFDTLRLRGTLYFRTDFSPPWAISVPDFERAARFHLVVQGRCHVRMESGRAVDLAAGDLVVIPAGRAHVLADQPDRTAVALDDVLKRSGFQGEGTFVIGNGDPQASTRLVCGHLSYDIGGDHPLVQALPEVIVMRPTDRARAPLLDDTLRMVARCVFADELGSGASIARLSEVFFIETVRVAVAHHPALARIIAAMTDPQIGRVLQHVHRAVGSPWTVETLAAAANMSRSRFAERFSELLGVAPMSYVTEWRLQKARARLADGDASVKAIAGEVGYQSPAAFTRAFSARFGCSPSDVRR